MNESALIFAKALNGKGGCEQFQHIDQIASSNGPIWLHFDANHPETIAIIEATFPDIDDQTLRAILDLDARPRLLELEQGLLVLLRGINHNQGEQPEDMIGVRLWFTHSRLISLRYRKSKAVMQVAQSLDDGKGPNNIGEILSNIGGLLIEFIENGIDQLDDRLDSLETLVLEDPGKTLRHDISEVRKKAILIRRYLAPQREVLSQLRNVEMKWMTKEIGRKLQEVYDGQVRGLESLDAIRERSQVVTDELINALSEKLNRNLYVLSVITAIFLPLGFLTGLFGINVGGLPGVDNGNAFTYFTGALFVITLVQVIVFKILKWF